MTEITDTLFRVVDTETTGTDPAVCKIVEVGACDVRYADDAWRQGEAQAWLCNPGVQIPPEAKATHHITDAMVAGEPSVAYALSQIYPGAHDVVWVAHNAAFDRAMLEAAGMAPGGRWLCTWRLARHVWPLAPSFRNEALRYWLGYDELPWGSGGQTHRAAHDAAVTALLLRRALAEVEGAMIVKNDVDALITWSEEPVLLRGALGFGKHAAKTWDAVDVDYLRWMLGEERKKPGTWDKDRLHTARHYSGQGSR
jgi:exodeoxyribonuclease X